MITLKTAEEIELLRSSCQIARDTLLYLEGKIEAGMTTKDLDCLAHDYIKAQGAIPSCLGYHGYPASICTSVNNCIVHGIPSSKQILQNGDIVSVDLVAYKNGFHGDAARTFAVGKVSAQAEKLIQVTKEAFFKAIDGLFVGSPLNNIGAKVQEHAEKNGFEVVREFVGHGIGREMHEDPAVPNFGKAGTGIRLKAGMVLCIEPMIVAGKRDVTILKDGWTAVTTDGSLAAHYENTIVITEQGVEILSL